MKKNIKNLLSLLLCIVIIFSLSACRIKLPFKRSSSENEKSSAASKSESSMVSSNESDTTSSDENNSTASISESSTASVNENSKVPNNKSSTVASSESSIVSEEGPLETEGINWAPGELFGIAFLGYADNLDDEDMQLMYDYYKEAYPVLKDYTKSAWVEAEGNEVFVIIPRYKGSQITVREYYVVEENELGPKLYSGTNDALFLLCNFSDLHFNTNVTVDYYDDSESINPYVSLMDGSAAIPEGGRVHDLTLN